MQRILVIIDRQCEYGVWTFEIGSVREMLNVTLTNWEFTLLVPLHHFWDELLLVSDTSRHHSSYIPSQASCRLLDSPIMTLPVPELGALTDFVSEAPSLPFFTSRITSMGSNMLSYALFHARPRNTRLEVLRGRSISTTGCKIEPA
jgi:hypothetical protein